MENSLKYIYIYIIREEDTDVFIFLTKGVLI